MKPRERLLGIEAGPGALGHLHHFERPRPVRQSADEAALLQSHNQAMDARFRLEIQGLLHLVERGRDTGCFYTLVDK